MNQIVVENAPIKVSFKKSWSGRDHGLSEEAIESLILSEIEKLLAINNVLHKV